MWLSTRYAAIVRVARKPLPRVPTQDIPFPHHVTLKSELHHHVQSRISGEQVATRSPMYMVQVIEAGQRSVPDAAEARQFVYEYFCRSTNIEFSIAQRARLKKNRGQAIRSAHFRRSFVHDFCFRPESFCIDAKNQGFVVKIPLPFSSENAESLVTSRHVQISHRRTSSHA